MRTLWFSNAEKSSFGKPVNIQSPVFPAHPTSQDVGWFRASQMQGLVEDGYHQARAGTARSTFRLWLHDAKLHEQTWLIPERRFDIPNLQSSTVLQRFSGNALKMDASALPGLKVRRKTGNHPQSLVFRVEWNDQQQTILNAVHSGFPTKRWTQFRSSRIITQSNIHQVVLAITINIRKGISLKTGITGGARISSQ
jgi:hypothetical protein